MFSFSDACIIFPTLRFEADAEPEVTTVLATVDPAEAEAKASRMIWSCLLPIADPTTCASSDLSEKFTFCHKPNLPIENRL